MRIDYAHKHWLRELQRRTVASDDFNCGFAAGFSVAVIAAHLLVLAIVFGSGS
jgi:hypothetical protein